MSEKITIAGHGGRIELIVHGYERENALVVADANWLRGILTVEIGPFTGTTKLSIETHDIKSFYDQLKRLNQGDNISAELRPVEEVVQCTVTMTTLGHALISGMVKVSGTVNVEFSFSFESDQSFLRQTTTDLETLVRKFPVKS